MARKKRIPVSKKVRFEVFKRDFFTCQYCGDSPPKVILEVDHIIPVVSGGGNDTENLLTACFNCNRGKGKHHLSSIPETLEKKAELLAEKEEQIKAYNRLLSQKRARETRVINRLDAIYSNRHSEYQLSESFKDSIRNNFMPCMTADQLEKAMVLALSRVSSDTKCLKYFCGICWKIVRGEGDGSI